MIEKIGHVKNPLTVIAMFAGIAEVSGTVVLPFLDKEIQRIFVWFLMGFPSLLVLLFFITLMAKHYVLYAPSDFRDDKLFADLFVRSSGADRVQKIEAEVDLEPADASTSQDASGSISAKDIFTRNVRATYLLAEELVLAKLSKEMGVQLDRGVSPRGQRNVVFDAVALAGGRTLVIDVKFTRRGELPRQFVAPMFDKVATFVSTLPSALQQSFQFIFAVAFEGLTPERVERLRTNVSRVAAEYSFNTRVEMYSLSDLEREFHVK